MKIPFLKKHIKEGYICPFCGETGLVGESIDVGDVLARQEMQCVKCMRVWTDVYKLTRIEVDEGEERIHR